MAQSYKTAIGGKMSKSSKQRFYRKD